MARDIGFLILPHPCHMDQHEGIRMDAVQFGFILGYHGGVHVMIERYDLFFVIH